MAVKRTCPCCKEIWWSGAAGDAWICEKCKAEIRPLPMFELYGKLFSAQQAKK